MFSLTVSDRASFTVSLSKQQLREPSLLVKHNSNSYILIGFCGSRKRFDTDERKYSLGRPDLLPREMR